MMRALAHQAAVKAPLFAAPELALALEAFSKADEELLSGEGELLGPIARQTVRKAADLDAQDLASVAAAFASSDSPPLEVFQALGGQAALVAETFTHQKLSVTLRSFAVARYGQAEVFRALGQQALLMAEGFSPQGLTVILWAFASVRVKQPWELFLALGEQAALKVQRLSLRDLSLSLSALSLLGVSEPEVYSSLAEAAASRAGELSRRDIAEITRAFARVGSPVKAASDPVFEALRPRVVAEARLFNGHGLAQVALAFVASGNDTRQLIDAVGAAAVRKAQDMDAADLARTARALAASRHQPPPPGAIEALADAAAELPVEELNPRCVALLIDALGAAEEPRAAAVDALAAVAVSTASAFRPRDIAMALGGFGSCWGLRPSSDVFEALGAAAAERPERLSPEELQAVVEAFCSVGVPLPSELLALSASPNEGGKDGADKDEAEGLRSSVTSR